MPQSGMHRAVVYMIKYNNNMFNSYGQSKNVRLSARIVQLCSFTETIQIQLYRPL